MMRRTFLASHSRARRRPGVEANLLDIWQEVQERLAVGDAGLRNDRSQILKERAVELEMWRLTPFAAALVAWAEANQGDIG